VHCVKKNLATLPHGTNSLNMSWADLTKMSDCVNAPFKLTFLESVTCRAHSGCDRWCSRRRIGEDKAKSPKSKHGQSPISFSGGWVRIQKTVVTRYLASSEWPPVLDCQTIFKSSLYIILYFLKLPFNGTGSQILHFHCNNNNKNVKIYLTKNFCNVVSKFL
jgi:hypothetical protein